MKKTFIHLLIIVIFIFSGNCVDSMVLKAGVSLSDQVPKGYFGTWKITSTMEYSNNPEIFNEITTDYWNLSKSNDVITLTNPVSGAEAAITVEDVKGNRLKFTHTIESKNAKMTETPELTLNGENFSGTDKIIIEKYKHGEKTDEYVVVYKITAKKLSGDSAAAIFMSEK